MHIAGETVAEEKERLARNRDTARERASWHHKQRNFWKDQAARSEAALLKLEREERLAR
jgi:hypothetical protein